MEAMIVHRSIAEQDDCRVPEIFVTAHQTTSDAKIADLHPIKL
jgi:hypothetical protein